MQKNDNLSEKIFDLVVSLLEEQQGRDIVKLHSPLPNTAVSAMLIVTSNSPRHSKGMGEKVCELIGQYTDFRSTGFETGYWVIISFMDAAVHIMSAHARDYYALDKLWSGLNQPIGNALLE